MKKITEKIPSALYLIALVSPFFIGLLFIPSFTFDSFVLFSIFLQRYFIFLSLFGAWAGVAHLVQMYRDTITAQAPRRRQHVLLAGLIILIFFSLLELTMVKIKFELPLFYASFILLGQMGLIRYFMQQRRAWPYLCASFLFDFLITIYSFQMLRLNYQWQIAAVAFGIACFLCVVRMASVFTWDSVWSAPTSNTHAPKREAGADSNIETSRTLRFMRIAYSILIFMGPLTIALLALFKQLHIIYVAVYIPILVYARLSREARALCQKEQIPALFARESTGVYLLFLVIIFGCKLLIEAV